MGGDFLQQRPKNLYICCERSAERKTCSSAKPSSPKPVQDLWQIVGNKDGMWPFYNTSVHLSGSFSIHQSKSKQSLPSRYSLNSKT